MQLFRDERAKQVMWAGWILLAVLVVTMGIRLLAMLPGVLGEWFGMIAGFLSTPVFLEISFFFLGGMIVLGLNHWRLKREGDEYVTMEELEARAKVSGSKSERIEG